MSNALSPSPAEQKLLLALGLCARARALIFGTPMVCEALRGTNPPSLVLEASDTSDNTHKRLSDKCAFYKVRLLRLPFDGAQISKAVGKTAPLAALAIRDAQLTRLVRSHLASIDESITQSDEIKTN